MQNEICLNTIGNHRVETSTKTHTNVYSSLYSTNQRNTDIDSDSDDDCKPSSAASLSGVANPENTENNEDEECDYGYDNGVERNRIDGECHHFVRRNSCLINKDKSVLTAIVEGTSILGLGCDVLTPNIEGPPRMSDRDLRHDQMRKADLVIAMYNQ
jgi:hypothetical protein